jgi:N-acetylglucosamine-6-sulfatase
VVSGVRPASDVDGRSLTGLLHGRAEPGWRTAALVEHRGPVDDPTDPDRPEAGSGNPPSYKAVRTARYTYVEYVTGEHELYDRLRDPRELDNRYGSLSVAQRSALHRRLAALAACRGTSACARAGRVPDPPL